MSSISNVWQELSDKEYRDSYTEAQLSIEVPFQIRALRKARGWTQAQLAERCGISQAQISHIEQPGRDPLSLRTLYRLSAVFDVGLLVQFVPFSELVYREAAFDPKTFYVPSFKEDRLKTTGRTAFSSISLSSQSESTREMWRLHTARSEWKTPPQIFPPLPEVKWDIDVTIKLPFSNPLNYNERTQYGYETQATYSYETQATG